MKRRKRCTGSVQRPDGPEARDGGWSARALGAALTAMLPGHGTPLEVILAAAICDVRARWNTTSLDLLVLADSPALLHHRSGHHELVADNRLAATAPAERDAYRHHLLLGRGFDTDFADLIAAVQRTERRSFNTADGFWVAEADPTAAVHAVSRTLPIDELDAITLMSDGATAGVLDYHLATWTGMADQLARDGTAAWLDRVHRAESSDPDGSRWPRTKRHDDKTTLHLSRLTQPE